LIILATSFPVCAFSSRPFMLLGAAFWLIFPLFTLPVHLTDMLGAPIHTIIVLHIWERMVRGESKACIPVVQVGMDTGETEQASKKPLLRWNDIKLA
jgi:hypothetical protein